MPFLYAPYRPVGLVQRSRGDGDGVATLPELEEALEAERTAALLEEARLPIYVGKGGRGGVPFLDVSYCVRIEVTYWPRPLG